MSEIVQKLEISNVRRFNPYSAYKPSGVEWLGNVPEHWEVKRSDQFVTTERRQVTPEQFAGSEVFHYSIPVVQETGTGAVEEGENIASAKQLVTQPVLLVSKLNPRKATVCIATPRPILTLCSTEFVALQATGCDLKFLYYLALSELFRQRLDANVQSVTRSHQRANPEQIYKFWTAWPSPDEQRTIADFLDRETAKIDTLIAKKWVLVEKLKEKRSALISRTVTRGLPPDAARAAGLDPRPPLKPSGVDWLGDIPKHWAVLPYKRLCNRVDVGIAEAATHAYCDDGIAIIRSTNVRPNALDTTDVLRIEPWFAEKNKSKTLHAGDLVTVRTGYPGTTAVIPQEYEGSQCFTLVMSTPKRNECSRFFSYLFNSAAGSTYFEMEGWGTAQTNISVPIVQCIPVARPPANEQRLIVAFLDSAANEIDSMLAKIDNAIERLQEYRTALIAAAVTGKIDVRGSTHDN